MKFFEKILRFFMVFFAKIYCNPNPTHFTKSRLIPSHPFLLFLFVKLFGKSCIQLILINILLVSFPSSLAKKSQSMLFSNKKKAKIFSNFLLILPHFSLNPRLSSFMEKIAYGNWNKGQEKNCLENLLQTIRSFSKQMESSSFSELKARLRENWETHRIYENSVCGLKHKDTNQLTWKKYNKKKQQQFLRKWK